MKAEFLAAGIFLASCAQEASWPPPDRGVPCTGDIAPDGQMLARELDMLARTAPSTVGPLGVAEEYRKRVRRWNCSQEAVDEAQRILWEEDAPGDDRDI